MTKQRKMKKLEKAIDALIDIRVDVNELYHPEYEKAIGRLNDDAIRLHTQIDD